MGGRGHVSSSHEKTAQTSYTINGNPHSFLVLVIKNSPLLKARA